MNFKNHINVYKPSSISTFIDENPDIIESISNFHLGKVYEPNIKYIFRDFYRISIDYDCLFENSLKVVLLVPNVVYIPNFTKLGINISSISEQGVLYLGCALTTNKCYQDIYLKVWGMFIKKLLKYISMKVSNVVFMTFGKIARETLKASDIDSKHKTIICNHPYNIDIKIFDECNSILKDLNYDPIIWYN